MTLPATSITSSGDEASAVRISRVEAMLSTSRSSVVASSSDGKTLNSSGLVMFSVVSRISTASEMFMLISRSSTTGGSGTRITASSSTNVMGTNSER